MGDKFLQMKLKACKQSILNVDSLLTLNEESKNSDESRSAYSDPERKNSVQSSADDDQSCLSDATSSEESVHSDDNSGIILPPVTLKGLFMNLKKSIKV